MMIFVKNPVTPIAIDDRFCLLFETTFIWSIMQMEILWNKAIQTHGNLTVKM